MKEERKSTPIHDRKETEPRKEEAVGPLSQSHDQTARAHMRYLSTNSNGRLGKKTWTRDDLHAR